MCVYKYKDKHIKKHLDTLMQKNKKIQSCHCYNNEYVDDYVLLFGSN